MTTPDTPTITRDLLALRDKISPGPWRVSYERGTTQIRTADNKSIMCDETYYPWVPDNMVDWDLIAAAPDMLDLLEALSKENERLREAIQKIADFRQEAEAYDEDVGHEVREWVDTEEWEMVEDIARTALQEPRHE